ncbi:MAG: hypothetical protein HY270_02505 [Deltaproteobacteria bacterium]|nr:hypothetical protein [Deltaproteobacteria bacterium]
MRRFLLAGLLLLGVVSTAAVPSQASASSAYTLTAQGTWVSNDGLLNGTWQAHFDIAGFDLSGTLNILGLPGVADGNIAGSWDLSNIGFGVMFLNQEMATFNGGLQGNHLVGTFDTSQTSGSWTGALDSLKLSNIPIVPIIDATIPTLLLSHSSGNLGDIVNLAASLYTLGAPIAGIDNTITFDNIATPILALANGTPNCTVNPLIDKADSFFQFLPQGCSGSTCTQIRAVIQSLSNLAPIADGSALYTCKVKIAAQAASGIYQFIANALQAVDISQLPLPITALNGEIGAKIPWFKNILKNGCHCSTIETAGPLPLTSLLAPLLLVGLRRRERNRSSMRK